MTTAAGGPLAWWRARPEVLRGTGAPLQWPLAVGAAAGAALGGGAGLLLGFGERSIQSAVVAAFVLAAGSMLPARLAVPVAALVGATVLLSSVVADATTGSPAAAAVAMALVMFATSVLTASVPLGLLLGMCGSYVYMVVSGFGVIATYTRSLDAFRGLVVSLVGVLAALVGVAVLSWVRRGRDAGSPPGDAADRSSTARPDVVGPVLASLRTFDRHARDGVRRGLALGVAMFLFQVSGTRDAFWMLLAAFVVLLPNGRSPLPNALARVAGTFAGALVVGGLAVVLPPTLLLPLGAAAMILSLAYAQRSAAMAATLGAMAAVVLVGVPEGAVLPWAVSRFVDTLVGATLGLVFGYLLWPKDKPVVEVPPDDVPG